MTHSAFMHRCLDLASQGRGRVGNGAMVGAVLVRDGRVIAEGFHAAYGEAHAERRLLEQFKDPVHPEDVLYVNLEPCCHQGKTPPCTDIIIQRGIKHVVYGMQDPDSRVAGKGTKALESAGIEVIGPIERSTCEYFNKGFIKVRQTNRPWITIKMAKDRAGRVHRDGKTLKITSLEQDQWSHSFLRARCDAILVGIGNILIDNPNLNTRLNQNYRYSLLEGLNDNKDNQNNFINPYRIVLDASFSIPIDAKVASTSDPERTIVCTASEALKKEKAKLSELHMKGVIVISVPMIGKHFEWEALWKALVTPQGDFYGITSVLVEGGPTTWKIFRDAGFIDEEITLIGAH